MPATDYNRLVRIERRVTSGDGFNWATFKRAFAKKLTGPGRETFAGSQVLAATDARFSMPWFSGVDATMRLVDERTSEIFNIVAVEADDDMGVDYLMLRVQGGTNQG